MHDLETIEHFYYLCVRIIILFEKYKNMYKESKTF